MNGTFGNNFKMDRMTWIKPSFLWMMYRAQDAKKIANYEIVHDENNAKNMLRNMVNDAWERRHLVEMISDGMGEI